MGIRNPELIGTAAPPSWQGHLAIEVLSLDQPQCMQIVMAGKNYPLKRLLDCEEFEGGCVNSTGSVVAEKEQGYPGSNSGSRTFELTCSSENPREN